MLNRNWKQSGRYEHRFKFQILTILNKFVRVRHWSTNQSSRFNYSEYFFIFTFSISLLDFREYFFQFETSKQRKQLVKKFREKTIKIKARPSLRQWRDENTFFCNHLEAKDPGQATVKNRSPDNNNFIFRASKRLLPTMSVVLSVGLFIRPSRPGAVIVNNQGNTVRQGRWKKWT